MLTVVPLPRALALIRSSLSFLSESEEMPAADCVGRILTRDIYAREDVPPYTRSAVDGYAVRCADTVGASPSLPALLCRIGEAKMGTTVGENLAPGTCMAVSTGSMLPGQADGVCMSEYAELFDESTVGVVKTVAVGENAVRRGEDTACGELLLPAERRLTPPDIGVLVSQGIVTIPVQRKIKVGIVSTGDELVPFTDPAEDGKIRDCNLPVLSSFLTSLGALPLPFGICPDEKDLLRRTLRDAAEKCDLLLVSGGTSAGEKDAMEEILRTDGHLLFHGIAVKPGKPTLYGFLYGKPLLALPGHPSACYFTARLLAREALSALMGQSSPERVIRATLTENVSANQGRAVLTAVRLRREGDTLFAEPLRGKSSLLRSSANADGFFLIPRDCEGFPAGTETDILRIGGEL